MLRKNLINARGLRTQSKIAELCGVKQQTYSHWERGVATPPVQKMIMLEKVLAVPKEQLFFDIFNSYSEYNVGNQKIV